MPTPTLTPHTRRAQVWKAAGMDMTNVEFLWASDEINTHANDYWLRVMDIARKFSVPRVRSSSGCGLRGHASSCISLGANCSCRHSLMFRDVPALL